MSARAWSRRGVLRCAGGALLLPWLEACAGPDGRPDGERPKSERTERARSTITTPAKRFVAFGIWNGVIPSEWFPDVTGTDFVLKRMLEPLAAHRDAMILTKGIDNTAALTFAAKNGHVEGVTSLLGGYAPLREEPVGTNTWLLPPEMTSIDQAIADHIAAQGVVTRVGSLQLAVPNSGGTYGGISTRTGQPLGGNTNPKNVFDMLFQDLLLSEEEQRAIRRRRLSVLDGSAEDFARLSKKVSGEDRRRIDAHLERIRSVEKRMQTNVTCDPSTLGTIVDPADNGEAWSLHHDVAVIALSCDVTRVVTFSFDHGGGGGQPFPWLGVDEDWHEISHRVGAPQAGDTATESFVAIHRWFASEMARFVDALKAVVTPEGTLFDETVLFRGSELTLDHWQADLPLCLLAGNKTPFRRGQYLAYATPEPHNKLLTTLAHAFGMEATSFGDPSYPGDLDADLLTG